MMRCMSRRTGFSISLPSMTTSPVSASANVSMIRRARALGMKLMLGCMVESSVGVAAAAMVASEVDWLDLDGNLLLADDPFGGLELGPDCRWRLTSRAGLGVHRKPLA